MAREFVYLVQARETKNIKIGWSRNLWNRLAAIQAHSGDRIDLRMHFVGSHMRRHEQHLHKMFKPHRLYNEWYSPAPEIIELIDDFRGRMTPEELRRYDVVQARWISDPVSIL